MGDPAGIGPEICIKALSALLQESETWADRLELHGSIDSFDMALKSIAGRSIHQSVMSAVQLVETTANPARDTAHYAAGQPSAITGQLAFLAIQSALAGIKAGSLAGLVTAPISKKALNSAGHLYPGHTEILSAAAGGIPVRMMLANEELAVVLVTIHLPLKKALESITFDGIVETIRITDAHFRQTKGRPPSIAVAGLNPHAGEEGLLGSEEIEIIGPAIAHCRSQGINACGPYPPDTIFMQARKSGEHDAVVAQYHDQGLIPVKYLGVEHGVNVTLGLPFVRTSPDHGTAFDIAGKDVADPSSMIAAIRMADAMTRGRGR